MQTYGSSVVCVKTWNPIQSYGLKWFETVDSEGQYG